MENQTDQSSKPDEISDLAEVEAAETVADDLHIKDPQLPNLRKRVQWRLRKLLRIKHTANIYKHGGVVIGQLDLTRAKWIRTDDSKADPLKVEQVEIAYVEHTDGLTYTAMRKSIDPYGTVLVYTPKEWEAFLLGAKDGEFDEPW